ncbi:MAG: FtsX-like permease family protein [Acidimicrobiia bacterium]
MLKVALSGLRTNKVRLALTSLAIVIGVAFVSGSFVFTDTINARFDALLGDISAGTDVYVRAADPEFGNDFGQIILSMPEEVFDTVSEVEGVAEAEAVIDGFAQLIGNDGVPIGGQGPPTLGTSWMLSRTLNPLQIREGNGRAPNAPGEVAMDAGTARVNAFSLGDDVVIQATGPAETFRLVGLASFGEEDNLAGATLLAFEFAEAQRVFDLDGRITSIAIAATPGVSPEDLVERIEPVVPEGVIAITVSESNAQTSEQIAEALGFLTIGLLAFATVAVFVGAFIITNTFRIIVAQRTRELALLRAIGATGGQVTRMVVAEAFVIAVISSILGVIGGIVLALSLQALLRFANAGFPEGPLTVLPRTAVIGLAVGIVVTVVSALLPARKAASIPPIAAMTAVLSAPTRKSLTMRAAWGVAITAIGVASLAAGLFAPVSNAIWFVAIGALVVFVGISVLAPLAAGPITSVLGWPLPRLFGVPGDLASQNTRRQPRRTASTASALMIGVALVVFVAIFGASVKSSVGAALADVFPADLTITSTNFTAGVSPAFTDQLRAAPEIGDVTPLGFTQIRVDDEVVSATSVEPDSVNRVIALGASDTDLAAMADRNGLLVNREDAEYEQWLGRTFDVEFPNGASAPATVVGTFEASADGFGRFLMTRDRYLTGIETEVDSLVSANVAVGVTLDEARTAVEELAAPFPNLQVQTTSEILATAEAQINGLLTIFSALLALAIIIAVLGITNTLALSIIERTREIGLLRAVGMARRQVRRMVRWEAVLIAVFGAILGMIAGIGLGWAVVTALADEGLGTFSIPFGQLLVYIVIAAVAGVIAAIYPARKAARMNILEAIAYE